MTYCVTTTPFYKPLRYLTQRGRFESQDCTIPALEIRDSKVFKSGISNLQCRNRAILGFQISCTALGVTPTTNFFPVLESS
jgi:hypothetical protein